MQALKNKVILEVDDSPQKTKGGIFLPVVSKVHYANVVSVGKKVKELKAGDRVRYNPKACQEFEYEGKEYLMTVEDTIPAIENKD